MRYKMQKKLLTKKRQIILGLACGCAFWGLNDASVCLAAGDLTRHTISANGTTVNIGTAADPYATLNLNGGSGSVGINALGGSTQDGVVNVYANNITIEYNDTGIRSNANINSPYHKSIVNIGDSTHYTQNLTIKGTNDGRVGTGILSVWGGENDIYATNINIKAIEGISSYKGNTAGLSVNNIYTGSNAGEGLVIDATNYGLISYEYGVNNVLAGNVNITAGMLGIYSGTSDWEQALFDNAGVNNLGTATNRLGDVSVTATNGVALQSNAGTIGIYATNVKLTAPMYVIKNYNGGDGDIEIHGTGTTSIDGSIRNFRGTVNVNTLTADGTTQMIGNIISGHNQVDYASATELSLNDADSYLQGYINDSNLGATTLDVTNSSHWYVTNDSNLDTLKLTSDGVVDFTNNNTDLTPDRTITTKNLTGGGGTLLFNTNLQNSADNRDVLTSSDKLYITDSSSGAYTIDVVDHSATKATEGYVLLVKDSSATPGATFEASANVRNGGMFAYKGMITDVDPTGYENVPTGSKNWYLTVDPTPDPEPTPTYNGIANIGMAESRYGWLFNEQDNLLKRLGELRDNENTQGIWARYRHGEQGGNGSYLEDGKYSMFQLGYDKKTKDTKDMKQFTGIAFNHTMGSNTYRGVDADVDNIADALTFYNTNLYQKGHYLDLVAKVGKARGDFNLYGDFPERADTDSWFYSASAEYGRKKMMGNNGWYIEPQVQLTWSHLGGDDYTTNQGNHASLDGINSLIFRTGTTIGRHLDGNQKSNYYAKVFWNREFSGDTSYNMVDKNGTRYDHDYDYRGNWWTVGVGGNWAMNDKTNLYLDLEKNFGGELTTRWQVNAGARWAF